MADEINSEQERIKQQALTRVRSTSIAQLRNTPPLVVAVVLLETRLGGLEGWDIPEEVREDLTQKRRALAQAMQRPGHHSYVGMYLPYRDPEGRERWVHFGTQYMRDVKKTRSGLAALINHGRPCTDALRDLLAEFVDSCPNEEGDIYLVDTRLRAISSDHLPYHWEFGLHIALLVAREQAGRIMSRWVSLSKRCPLIPLADAAPDIWLVFREREEEGFVQEALAGENLQEIAVEDGVDEILALRPQCRHVVVMVDTPAQAAAVVIEIGRRVLNARLTP